VHIKLKKGIIYFLEGGIGSDHERNYNVGMTHFLEMGLDHDSCERRVNIQADVKERG
jgi:hypothetical protein